MLVNTPLLGIEIRKAESHLSVPNGSRWKLQENVMIQSYHLCKFWIFFMGCHFFFPIKRLWRWWGRGGWEVEVSLIALPSPAHLSFDEQLITLLAGGEGGEDRPLHTHTDTHARTYAHTHRALPGDHDADYLRSILNIYKGSLEQIHNVLIIHTLIKKCIIE